MNFACRTRLARQFLIANCLCLEVFKSLFFVSITRLCGHSDFSVVPTLPYLAFAHFFAAIFARRFSPSGVKIPNHLLSQRCRAGSAAFGTPARGATVRFVVLEVAIVAADFAVFLCTAMPELYHFGFSASSARAKLHRAVVYNRRREGIQTPRARCYTIRPCH